MEENQELWVVTLCMSGFKPPHISKGRKKALPYSPLPSHVGPKTSDPRVSHLVVVHFGCSDWCTGRAAQWHLGREAVMILLCLQMRRVFEQICCSRGCEPPHCLPMLSLIFYGVCSWVWCAQKWLSSQALPCLGHAGAVACFQP